MIAAVEQRYFDIDHGIAGEHAVLGRLSNTLLNRGNIFARDRAAFDRVDELESAAGLLAAQA